MRFVLVLEVEDVNEEPFREWVLHCTLVPWFVVESNIDTFITELQGLFKDVGPLELEGISNELFGSKRNLPVTIVRQTDTLRSLHFKTMALLEKEQASFSTAYGNGFSSDMFIRENYTPHVTAHGGRELAIGQKCVIRKVALVRSVSEAPKIRQKYATFYLGLADEE